MFHGHRFFACALITVSLLAARPALGVLLYATSGSDLARFDSGATGVVTSVPVTGLQTGESLVGIDVRPANQVVYGVGTSSRLYTINPLTGAATQVGAAGAFALSGTSFAFDFNPVPDRIRVISNTGQIVSNGPSAKGSQCARQAAAKSCGESGRTSAPPSSRERVPGSLVLPPGTAPRTLRMILFLASP